MSLLEQSGEAVVALPASNIDKAWQWMEGYIRCNKAGGEAKTGFPIRSEQEGIDPRLTREAFGTCIASMRLKRQLLHVKSNGRK